MRVSEAVEHMTKQYLQRIVDSFTRDFPRLNEERARETIVRNVDELSDPERVQKRLSFREAPLSQRILQSNILEVLLNDLDNVCVEGEIVEKGQALERSVLEEARREDAFKYEPTQKVEILRTVLAMAENEAARVDQAGLLGRLRVSRASLVRMLSGWTGHSPKTFRASSGDRRTQ